MKVKRKTRLGQMAKKDSQARFAICNPLPAPEEDIVLTRLPRSGTTRLRKSVVVCVVTNREDYLYAASRFVMVSGRRQSAGGPLRQ